MFKPYVQSVDDWIKFYSQPGTSNKDSGDSTGGIGADSGSVANPVEKATPNNLKTIDSEMRQGQLTSMPGQPPVAPTAVKSVRRRKRRKLRRKKPARKRKKVKKAGSRVKKVRKGVAKKRKKRKKKSKKRRTERDLFDE
jgi:hypothetical protein